MLANEMHDTEFSKRVIAFIQTIPKGKVVSYGQVAAVCGSPRAARQVGAVLRTVPADSTIPWWRVINAQGVISIKGNWIATKEMQKALLEQEGVVVSTNFTVDIDSYRYHKR